MKTTDFVSLALLVVFAAFTPSLLPAAPPTHTLREATLGLLDFRPELEGMLDDFFDVKPLAVSRQLSNDPSRLLLPRTSVRSSPRYSKVWLDAAHDCIQAVRGDFVKYVGSGRRNLTRGQFEQLVANRRLPSRETPDAYFQKHDRDHDRTLTYEEFAPTVVELCSSFSPDDLAHAYLYGDPYPSGQLPTRNPVLVALGPLPVPPPLTISMSVVEIRIRVFSRLIGGTTFRDARGRLLVRDRAGVETRIPAILIPLQKDEGLQDLARWAREIGGTFIESDEIGLPAVVKNGKRLSIDEIPPALRPPYLAPSTIPAGTP